MSISKQSLFIICVNSCPATASISAGVSLSISPLVKTIQESLVFHHKAKAFIQGSSIIPILGVGNQREIHKFSTIL
jgi:hypothetical protein